MKQVQCFGVFVDAPPTALATDEFAAVPGEDNGGGEDTFMCRLKYSSSSSASSVSSCNLALEPAISLPTFRWNFDTELTLCLKTNSRAYFSDSPLENPIRDNRLFMSSISSLVASIATCK